MKHIFILSAVLAAFLFAGCTTNKTKNLRTQYTADNGRIRTANEHAKNVFMGNRAAGVLGDHVTNLIRLHDGVRRRGNYHEFAAPTEGIL